MNKKRDFQEKDTPSFYSGRKIRRVVEEEKYQEEIKHEEPVASSVPVGETNRVQEVCIETSQNRRIEQRRRKQQTANDPKAKLVRSLERNLTDSSQKHLIGVFGMNSDNTIADAMRELDSSVYELPRTRLFDDVFTLFANTMLVFVNTNSSIITGIDVMQKRFQVQRYWQAIKSCNSESYYDDGLTMLSMVSQRLERAEKCRELFSYITQYSRKNKFVWNIEVGIRELNYNLLENLSQIANENLVIIVSTLGPLEFEARNIGSQMGCDWRGSGIGHDILQKYIWFEDIIEAD